MYQILSVFDFTTSLKVRPKIYIFCYTTMLIKKIKPQTTGLVQK